MTTTLILIIGAALVWAIYLYNRLVRDRNRVLAAWSDIDVQLKRRHDLIPKPFSICRYGDVSAVIRNPE
jgi:LemA protein